MFSFFFNDTPPTEIYTLSLHDALPIYTFLFGVIILIANILKRAFSSQLADIREDRKSGSAGMPRPISYAVFCLKKKKRLSAASRHYRSVLAAQRHGQIIYRAWDASLRR